MEQYVNRIRPESFETGEIIDISGWRENMEGALTKVTYQMALQQDFDDQDRIRLTSDIQAAITNDASSVFETLNVVANTFKVAKGEQR